MIPVHRISTQTTRKFPLKELNSTFRWNWVFCFTLPLSSWWLINIFTELVVLSEIEKSKLLAGLRSRVVCLSCANLMNYQWPGVIYFQHLQNNYIVAKAMMTFAWFDPWTVKAPCRQFDELHMFPPRGAKTQNFLGSNFLCTKTFRTKCAKAFLMKNLKCALLPLTTMPKNA